MRPEQFDLREGTQIHFLDVECFECCFLYTENGGKEVQVGVCVKFNNWFSRANPGIGR